MERIRAKADSQKSLADTSKIVRMGMANRGHSLDINDKAVLRGCLDTLQDSISVRSVAGMSERLETIARKMGLKFNHHNTTFYISTETFYLEVRMDGEGGVVDTKIHHQSVERTATSHHLEQSSPEIAACLGQGDFTQFTEHLEGLIKVYDIPNCSALDKGRAWQALYHLERDLERVGGRAWAQDLPAALLQGVGAVQPRAGGRPLRLTYFLPPYELLSPASAAAPAAATAASLRDGALGYSATLALRPSAEPFLLPLASLLQGQDWLQVSKASAVALPAHPSLELAAPLPMSWQLASRLATVAGVEWLKAEDNTPLLSLLTRQASGGALDPANHRGLFVTLPDQQHCYFLTETAALQGQLVSHVPFRHPNQVPAIVALLRAQAQFNTLIASCVRTNSLEDVDTSVMMEVTCLDPLCKSLSITFEHPVEEGIATAEVDLREVGKPRCRVYSSSVAQCPEETADRVVQRSLSIPVTMRTIIHRLRGEARGAREEAGGHAKAEVAEHKPQATKVRAAPSSAACDPGGGVKAEPMDTSEAAQQESLNRDGPQATSQPGAQTLPARPTAAEATFRPV